MAQSLGDPPTSARPIRRPRPRSVADKPRRHECPPYCHVCPVIARALVDRLEPDITEEGPPEPYDLVMPECSGTAIFGPESCHCTHPVEYWKVRALEAERREGELRDYVADILLLGGDKVMAAAIRKSYRNNDEGPAT